MRIMYVEDNPANVFLVKRVAKMGNHEVISFVDGTEALARFRSVNPDLVLMDIQISGELNGLDVVRRLRADGVETPIVAVTAYAMVGDRERCLEAGCTDYMAKPLPIPQLVQLFQHYAQNAPTRLSTSEQLAVAVLQEQSSAHDTQPMPAITEQQPASDVTETRPVIKKTSEGVLSSSDGRKTIIPPDL